MIKKIFKKLFKSKEINFLTSYTDPRILSLFSKNSIGTIFEIGSRYGNEAIDLAKNFPLATIYAFECNPNTVEHCRTNLAEHKSIWFNDFALGFNEGESTFYPYVVDENPGASSFFKRIDADSTQNLIGYKIKIKTGYSVFQQYKLDKIDLLCMDVQGYELEVLKGFGNLIHKIGFIIMEEPAKNPDEKYLPKGLYSKYLNTPSPKEINSYMKSIGFKEVKRFRENYIEDNVVYKNIL
jgi:FkbM family methyltransferase